MAAKRISLISIPKAGKTTLISGLTELHYDILSIGFSLNEFREADSSETGKRVKTIILNITKIELMEHNQKVPPATEYIDGLVVVIPALDLFASESRHLWDWAISTGLPCIAFISKIDFLCAPRSI